MMCDKCNNTLEVIRDISVPKSQFPNGGVVLYQDFRSFGRNTSSVGFHHEEDGESFKLNTICDCVAKREDKAPYILFQP